MATRTATWVVGTAALSASLVVGGYLGLVAPQLAAAADTRAQASQLTRDNRDRRADLVALEEEHAHLDDLRADLARLREAVPTTSDVTGYLREVDALAREVGVAVTDVTPAQPLVPVAVPDAAHDVVVYPDGMVAVPVTMGVSGPYDAVLAFVDRLQVDTSRLTLIPALDAGSAGVAGTGTAGGLQVTLRAHVFALPSDVAGGADARAGASTDVGRAGDGTAPGTDGAPGTAPVLPTPPPGTNPFSTVG